MSILKSILALLGVLFNKFFYNYGQPIVEFMFLVNQCINNPDKDNILDLFALAEQHNVSKEVLNAFREAYNKLFGYDTEPDTILTDAEISGLINDLRNHQGAHWCDATVSKLASLMYVILNNHNVTQLEADTLMQLAYAKFKNKG